MATPPTTKLDRVRPTVVVRRRVVDVPSVPNASTHVSHDDDESGPPSSVNVARALKALRADEVKRLEEILDAEPASVVFVEPPTAREPAKPAVPTVRLGPSIALSELAARLGVSDQELITTLVTRGFFSVTVKTILPRELARVAAKTYGWNVEEHDEPEPEIASVKAKARAKKSTAKPKKTSAKKTSSKMSSKTSSNTSARGAREAKARAHEKPSQKKKTPLRRSS